MKARKRLTAINEAINEAKRFINFAEKSKRHLEKEIKKKSLLEREEKYYCSYYRDNKFAQARRAALDTRKALAKITIESRGD